MRSFFRRSRLAFVLVPALALTGTGVVAAYAATTATSFTLTVLNRSGAKVSVPATAVQVVSHISYPLRSGKVAHLPKGVYSVLTSVDTGDTTTLGAGIINVTGTNTMTIDARRGQKVAMALSPAPTGLENNLDVRLCSAGNPNSGDATYNVEAYGQNVYVIPLKTQLVNFAMLGSWASPLGDGGADAYVTLDQLTGVPAAPRKTFSQSALGTVTVVNRRGPVGSNNADLAVQPSAQGCALDMYAEIGTSDHPLTTRLHMSPAAWSIRSDTFATTSTGENWDIGGYFAERQVAAGKSSSLSFHNAVWGPGPGLPFLYNGRITYDMSQGFTDPYYTSSDTGSEGGGKAVATLALNGKTVDTVHVTNYGDGNRSLVYTVRTGGWYTLTNSSTRYYPGITFPAGMLSTKTVASYHFLAPPKASTLAGVDSMMLTPSGLNGWNQAKPGSTTNVTVRLARINSTGVVPSGATPTVRTVTAKMSANAGLTWRNVTVKKINGQWTAVVPNPSSGAVTLEVRATNTTGSYTDVKVFRAYAIG